MVDYTNFIPFSKRDKPVPEVYRYDILPNGLKEQIIHIWNDMFGEGILNQYNANRLDVFREIERYIAREHGLSCLYPHASDFREACIHYLRNAGHKECLDLIEYSFLAANWLYAEYSNSVYQLRASGNAEDGITELNFRFRQHGVGYQFENSRLVRIDSQYVHAEVTKPALMLLSGKGFAGPNKEFMEAHGHYRNGRHEDAVATCRKAFESTMKAICDARGWKYDPNATAKPLVKAMFDNGLFPPALQSYFDNLRTMMETCVPTLANKNASHGSGPKVRVIGDELAAYVLHQTASNIVFLIQSHNCFA